MTAIAIIPARGGSKRIPRKNIRDFLGKPIIAYSIETALASKVFDEVMVSTEDEEIAEIAKKYGASIPFRRSMQNANDYATTVDVIAEVIRMYETNGKRFKYGCCIYPTAPFVTTDHIIEGYDILTNQSYDTVFPIVKFSYPIWRAIKKEDDRVSMIWPEYMLSRSQDLPDTFHDAGQWYWFNAQSILTSNKLWTANTHALEISDIDVQDIDNEDDWKIAELKFRLRKS